MKLFELLTMTVLLTMSLITSDLNDDSLRYYQPKYQNNHYYTILSSGTENETHETWGVDKNDIEKLPFLNLKEIRFHEFEQNAKAHLEKRYEEIILTLVEIKLERITDQDLGNDRNWCIIVTFRHHENGYVQMVPLLIDGRIILSTNEN